MTAPAFVPGRRDGPEVDIAIVGGGPAGAVAALNLAPSHRVVVIEQRVTPLPRIGESLPPAARRLLAAMGLWEAFVAERHAACHGNAAWWGDPAWRETDFLRDLDGHGWHLDRARFEAWLRRQAIARGAAIAAPVTLHAIARADGKADRAWRISLEGPRGPLVLYARAVIDATGRASRVARQLGARRTIDDRLVAGWLHLRDAAPATVGGFTHIVAEPDGWWYTAPLPDGRRVLAFHTDADLAAVRVARDPAALLARATAHDALAPLIAPCATDLLAGGVAAAHGAALHPVAGPGWAATGDAALAFDPLSSQGLLNSLYTGLAVAEATARTLAGDPDALTGYTAAVADIRSAYRAHVARWYRDEARWPHQPFWARRHGATTTRAPARSTPALTTS